MNKILTTGIIVAIITGGGAFYGGMLYGKSQTKDNLEQNFQQRAQQFGQNSAGNRGLRTGGQAGAGIANGEIISKDDKSIVIKLRDGGSKIIFYSTATEIGKFVSGALDDLIIGQNIMASGKTNEDSSLTAQSIQIRPMIAPTPSVP